MWHRATYSPGVKFKCNQPDSPGSIPCKPPALLKGGAPCGARIKACASSIVLPSASLIRLISWGCWPSLLLAGLIDLHEARIAFIVTPGFDAAVVDWCITNDVPVTPGVMTPTEINMALNKGLRLLKFFPAEAAGGVKTLKAIGGPYGGVKFIPTGGISLANLANPDVSVVFSPSDRQLSLVIANTGKRSCTLAITANAYEALSMTKSIAAGVLSRRFSDAVSGCDNSRAGAEFSPGP